MSCVSNKRFLEQSTIQPQHAQAQAHSGPMKSVAACIRKEAVKEALERVPSLQTDLAVSPPCQAYTKIRLVKGVTVISMATTDWQS